MAPPEHQSSPGRGRWRWRMLAAGVALGLLNGVLWAPVYGPFDPDWMQSAGADAFWGPAFSTAVAAAWVGVGALGFWSALRRSAVGACKPVAAVMLCVYFGFAVVVAASSSLDPDRVHGTRIVFIWFALAGNAWIALTASAVWRGVLAVGARRASGSDRTAPRTIPSPDELMDRLESSDPWRGPVRPPDLLLTVTAAIGFCVALGWFTQLIGIVLPDDGGWSEVAGMVVGLAAVALVLVSLAGLAQRWAGRVAAVVLLVVVGLGSGVGATGWLLRPEPSTWALAGVEPGGRALQIWVGGSCPNELSAEVVRRTADRLEIAASLRPPAIGIYGCALMESTARNLVEVKLDAPLDGERIVGAGMQQPDARMSATYRPTSVMPNVVGLSPHDALVLLGADRVPKTRASRLRGRFAFRLGDVRFTPSRGRVVIAQEPPIGTALETGVRIRRGVMQDWGGPYTQITLTTSE